MKLKYWNAVILLVFLKACKVETKTPLHDFLADSIVKMTINVSVAGCEYYAQDTVAYVAKNDTVLVSEYNEEIHISSLRSMLESINTHQPVGPTIQSFGITESEKETLLDTGMYYDAFEPYSDASKSLFHQKASGMLDTISSTTLISFFKNYENAYSTTSKRYYTEIVNSENEVLIIEKVDHHVDIQSPYNLPWKITYRDRNFNCYDPKLSKFLNNSIKTGNMDAGQFSNSFLLKGLASYLYDSSIYVLKPSWLK